MNTLVFSYMANPNCSIGDMAQTAAGLKVAVTPQGLDERFSEEGARFLQGMVERAAAKMLEYGGKVVPILGRFTRVDINDSTTISLPKALSDTWPGCGGSKGGESALKIQVRMDLARGGISAIALQAGKTPDGRADSVEKTYPQGQSLDLAALLADCPSGELDLP
jgi:hypothetical protein